MPVRPITLRKIIHGFPGYRRFGVYAFLPMFYVLGAALEFTMIHWRVGETNFYKTFKRTRSKEEAQRLFQVYLSLP